VYKKIIERAEKRGYIEEETIKTFAMELKSKGYDLTAAF